ncbi:MAG TPA: pentapeptide repeat-containing protein [Kofleriaceae bacterium]|nr:pentapeptide repeat-containing protein [Kofleriaceae bacterium]
MNELLDERQRNADLDESRRWDASQGKEGAPVSWYAEDLSGIDLTGAALGSGTLIDARFARSNLSSADLSRAQAGGADFTEANLDGANLSKAVLAGARFSDATCRAASFRKADLTNAYLAGAHLESAVFDGARCAKTSFVSADLSHASFCTAALTGADLRQANLAGARFERTVIDLFTRFDGCSGLETAEFVSIIVGDATLTGDAARSLLLERATPLAWDVVDFEIYLLERMGSERANVAARELCPDEARRQATAARVRDHFERLTLAAVDYERVLGPPVVSRRLGTVGGFVDSIRFEYRLPVWPDVVFVVNADSSGLPWGVQFEGGAETPFDPDDVRPWSWSDARLREASDHVQVMDAWNDDLELRLTFGARRFRATFKLGLLQEWTPADHETH